MKSLPNVTLIAYDNTDYPERTVSVLRHCAGVMRFASVVLVARVPPSSTLNGGTFYFVPDSGYAAAMQYEVEGINEHVSTDFALFVSHDGYIMNEDAWRDDWFDYDYIGAPWPLWQCNGRPEFRVGNSGFCLKSKPFLHYCAQLSSKLERGMNGDVFTSQII